MKRPIIDNDGNPAIEQTLIFNSNGVKIDYSFTHHTDGDMTLMIGEGDNFQTVELSDILTMLMVGEESQQSLATGIAHTLNNTANSRHHFVADINDASDELEAKLGREILMRYLSD